METLDKLRELWLAVQDDEIYNDCCDHQDPVNPTDYCNVCFIMNIYSNVSESEPEFFEETSEKQREKIEELWESLLN